MNKLRLKMKVNSFRGWLVTWLQRRRRSRQQPPPPQVPGAPQALLATDNGVLIVLNWTLGSGTITGQRIYRKVGAGSFGLWQTVAANATNAQDAGVVMASLYTYYVVAFNGVGDSGPSNQSSVLFGAA